jgi:hypothetical protein
MSLMFTIEQIESLFGQETRKYLQNKNRGGINGEKGSTYENYYALYQIAILARELIEFGQDATICSQGLAFVDDLVVDRHDETALRNYQLKNSATVSWGQGDKSIQDDFCRQQILNQAISRGSELYLVVSDSALQSTLNEQCPELIRDFSQVLYFPYQKRLSRLLDKFPSFRETIQYLCPFEDIDKVECTAGVLLGAITSSDRSTLSVREILEKASAFSPSYIRSLGGELSIDPQVANILSNIKDFTHGVSKGFLYWDYGGGIFTGTVTHRIDSEQFGKIQRLLKQCKPTSFAALQDFLL